MKEIEYIDKIKEQLRAYEFEQQRLDNNDDSIVFSKSIDEIFPPAWGYEFIIIETLDEYNVRAIERTVEKARNIYSSLRENVRLGSSCYLLIVSSSVTKPMRIRTKREHGFNLTGGDALLPIIADLENSQLVYKESSGLSQLTPHRKAVNNAEKYFRL